LLPALLFPVSICFARVVTVQPGDAFRDSLQGLAQGDTLYFSPGVYTMDDDLPLLWIRPGNHGVVVTSDLDDPAVLDGRGMDRPVVFAEGPLGPETVLENLEITGGSLLSGNWFGGGGISMLNAGCTVANCLVRGNTALLGGGVFAEGGEPVLDRMTVRDNNALVSGGGVCFYGSDPQFRNSVVSMNVSEDDGGGVYTYLGTLSGQNLLVAHNRSGDDGGAFMQLRGMLLLEFCTLHGNRAGDDGGGILVSSADSLSLESCLITRNLGKGGVQRKRGDEAVFVSHCCAWENEYGNYVNMDDPTGTLGNISADPLFADSLLRLSQPGAGQPGLSPCVDAGHRGVQGSAVEGLSTRTDSLPDQGTADMGRHFDPEPYMWNPDEPWSPFGMRLFPCPATDALYVRITSEFPVYVDVTVFDLSGRLAADLGSFFVEGIMDVSWPLPPEVPAGILLVRCEGPEGSVSESAVVLR
jgi:hypothetical protein